MYIAECGPTASISELKIRIMDLKIIIKQHSSELRLTGLHAIPPLSKPRRKGSGPQGRALGFPGCGLPGGLSILSPVLPPAGDVGLSGDSLLQQAEQMLEACYTMAFSAMVLSISKFRFQQISVIRLFENVILSILLILVREIIEGCSH